MSSAVHAYLASLFGKEDRSDCTVVFVAAKQSSEPIANNAGKLDVDRCNASDTVLLGDPLPAHLLLLCPGSAFFGALADRWTSQQGHGSRPELRVPLGSPEELPYAVEALRFIYSGSLNSSSTVELLRIRRLAAYLQVEGCVEACDKALVHVASQGLGSPSSVNLKGVVELYACRHLLPTVDEDPSAASLLNSLSAACVKQLRHASDPSTLGDGVRLGDLLTWLMPDATSVLNDREMKQLLRSLPVACMEALLGSDKFATDSEASVLLVLAEWFDAHDAYTSRGVSDRLCRLIRLRQLGPDYLHFVLPRVYWCPLSRHESAFLCRYAAADAATAAALAEAAGGRYDLSSPWYSSAPRPYARPDTGKIYEWTCPVRKLEEQLAEHARPGETMSLQCTFEDCVPYLVAKGLHWQPSIEYRSGASCAGVYLNCNLPEVLHVDDAEDVIGLVHPGSVELSVHAWQPDGSQSLYEFQFSDGGLFSFGGGRGWDDVLPLGETQPAAAEAAAAAEPAAAEAADPGAAGAGDVGAAAEGRMPAAMDVPGDAAAAGVAEGGGAAIARQVALWAPYIKDGRISGGLEWVKPSEGPAASGMEVEEAAT